MSEEITAPRSVPPVVEHQSAGERDLSDLRREVIESRNLVIKTDNLLKNLHAELKHMGRKQEQFEKRHMATSVAAYILFAAIATLGAFTFARSEIRGAREEAAANEGKVKQLTQEVDTLRRGEASRREASEKAARAYDLLGSEKEGPGQTLAMDQALHLDRQLISRLEAKALDDRAVGMKATSAPSPPSRTSSRTPAAPRRRSTRATCSALITRRSATRKRPASRTSGPSGCTPAASSPRSSAAV